MSIKVNAILIVSQNPKALADWYAQTFKVSFHKESHDHLSEHYVVILEDTRLIIHHQETYPSIKLEPGAISVAFGVESISDISDRLKKDLEIKEADFGKIAEVKDLEGNILQVVERNY